MTTSELLTEAQSACIRFTLADGHVKRGSKLFDRYIKSGDSVEASKLNRDLQQYYKTISEELATLRAIRLVSRKKHAGKVSADILRLIAADPEFLGDWCPK